MTLKRGPNVTTMLLPWKVPRCHILETLNSKETLFGPSFSICLGDLSAVTSPLLSLNVKVANLRISLSFQLPIGEGWEVGLQSPRWLVSKETVVLRRWGVEKNVWFINRVDEVI